MNEYELILPETLIEDIDRYLQDSDLSRSQFAGLALRNELQRKKDDQEEKRNNSSGEIECF